MTQNASEKSRKKTRKPLPRAWKHLLLALLALAIGITAMEILYITRRQPPKEPQDIEPPLVKVQQVQRKDIEMVVKGYGTIQPKVRAQVVPQVSGKVVAVSENFRDGGFTKAGETLIEIDPRDYELALQRAKADVAKAEVDLELEKAEADVAREEWEQMNPGKEPPSALVLRGPQIRQAETKMAAAQAQLATAELSLQRTKVSLPFDGRVVSENVDLGQFVNVGQPVGEVYGIEAVEIEVPLEDWELAWFDIPSNPVSINGNTPGTTGSNVLVKADFAAREHTWDGKVVRTTGEIDKTTRMVSVVVEVSEPFERSGSKPPLVPGLFVELEIRGRTLKDAVAIPRYAVHNGKQAWVYRKGTLNIQELRIVRQDESYAYVTSGIADGDQVVLSALDSVTDGMKVKMPGEKAPNAGDSNDVGTD